MRAGSSWGDRLASKTGRCTLASGRRPQEGMTMRKMSDIVRNQDPLTLPPDATVREACRCMRDRRVGAVLVIENDGRLAGIFTGRDGVHRILAEDKSASETKLAEVMTRDPDAMPPGKTAIEVLRLMEDGRTATCRLSTPAKSSGSCRDMISAASNSIGLTRRLASGNEFE